MSVGQHEKLKDAIKRLEHALTFKEKMAKDQFYYDGAAKAFEVALEYAWKYLKFQVEEEGEEVVSPKDAIRKAGKIGLISDVEIWLGFIGARNVAVHDYLGIPSKEYIAIAEEFLSEASKLLRRKS